MNKGYSVHWLLGAACVIVAFWGNYLAIPSQYVTGAGAMLPAILAHAMAFVPQLPGVEIAPDSAPVKDSLTTETPAP